jgi:hypothetical protein
MRTGMHVRRQRVFERCTRLRRRQHVPQRSAEVRRGARDLLELREPPRLHADAERLVPLAVGRAARDHALDDSLQAGVDARCGAAVGDGGGGGRATGRAVADLAQLKVLVQRARCMMQTALCCCSLAAS